MSDLDLWNKLWNTPGVMNTDMDEEWWRPLPRIIRKDHYYVGQPGVEAVTYQTLFPTFEVHEKGYDKSRCFCLTVYVEHLVFELAINPTTSGSIPFYNIAAHEMAHIRSMAALLFDLAHKESLLNQPCYDDPKIAEEAGKQLVRDLNNPGGKLDKIKDLERDHGEILNDYRIPFGMPMAGENVPWVGPTPEEKYGK